jgi:phage terminase Nu1 subunit (DNA packaging protein)
VIFQVSKESQYRLRAVQRLLRDHFTDLANEMLRSADDALRAARDANQLHADRKAARMAQVQHDLAELRQLRVRTAGLVAR